MGNLGISKQERALDKLYFLKKLYHQRRFKAVKELEEKENLTDNQVLILHAEIDWIQTLLNEIDY